MLRKQIEWLWKNMDAPYRRRHIAALLYLRLHLRAAAGESRAFTPSH